MIDLDEFTRRHWDILRHHAYRLTCSHLDAEDVAQETMLKAVEMGPALENVPNHSEWLHMAVTEVAVALLRNRRPFPVDEFDLPDLLQTTGPGAEADTRPIAGERSWPGASLHYLFPLQYMTPEQRAVLVLRDGLEDGDRLAATVLGVTLPDVFRLAQEAERRFDQLRKRWGGHVPFEPLPDVEAEERLFDRFIEVVQLRDKALLQSLMWDQVEMIVQGERISGQDFAATACADLMGRLGGTLSARPIWLNGCRGALFWTWRDRSSEWLRCAAVLVLCDKESVRAMKWYLDGHFLRSIRTEDPD
ncbi:MAG: sigma factor [bacterium]